MGGFNGGGSGANVGSGGGGGSDIRTSIGEIITLWVMFVH